MMQKVVLKMVLDLMLVVFLSYSYRTMRVLFFAVFLSIMQATPPVPRQTADNPAAASHKAHSQASANKPTSTAPSPMVKMETAPKNENTSNRVRTEDAQKSVRISELPSVSVKPDWRDNASLVFSLTLVVVTAIQAYLLCHTLRFVRIQSVIMRRQTKATESAAKAALENIELLINKERGRLTIEMLPLKLTYPPVPPATPTFPMKIDFKVCFYGSTPAFITEATEMAEVTNSKEPTDRFFLLPMSIPQIIPPQTTSLERLALLFGSTETKALDIQEGKKFIHFSGFIKYRDVFDRPRETTFRYRWHESASGLSSHWEKCGKPEDNRET